MLKQWRDERGAGSVGFVLAFPLFLGLVFLLVQAGMYYQAATVAQSAAQAGYHAARMADADSSKASSAAGQIIAQHPGTLRGAQVSVTEGPGEITVTVTGTSQSLVGDWVMPEVEKTVAGPLERVVIR